MIHLLSQQGLANIVLTPELRKSELRRTQASSLLGMVLELHVWGPAFGLPSIDADCNAAVAYVNYVLEASDWVLVPNHDASRSPNSTSSQNARETSS
jgi:hypothetical protein